MHNSVDIKDKLAKNSAIIEEALCALCNYSNDSCKTLVEVERYGLLEGGKRIRAFLVMELCRLFGGDERFAVNYACAVEMIHASSLIHDDMPCMDNDDMRRGKPSTHKAYGETLALIAGDSLMARAFEVIVDNGLQSSATNALAVKILANATGACGMLAGQTLDTVCFSKDSSLDSLIKLHEHKTGKLISASSALGCISAGIEPNDGRFVAARKYADSIGLAFQIIDDILDYREGKIEDNSFLSYMTESEASSYAERLTKEGIDAIAPYDDGTFEALANYLTVREY